MSKGRTSESLDVVYELLADSRRRLLLYQFRAKQVSTIEELSRNIAASERGVPVDSVSEEDRKSVVTALHHNHLPRLSSRGVIEFDDRSGDVVRSERFDEIRPFVEQAYTVESDESTVEWNRPIR